MSSMIPLSSFSLKKNVYFGLSFTGDAFCKFLVILGFPFLCDREHRHDWQPCVGGGPGFDWQVSLSGHSFGRQ